jgi:carboxymethylenebutenolidase
MPNETTFDYWPIRKSALTTGFAAAVQPVSAEIITTNDDGLFTSEISIPTSDGDIPGYIARPINGKEFPIVIVVHEIFGVHEHIKDLARRFAKLGYVAIAPELFARQGDVSGITDYSQLTEIVALVPDSQVLSDIDSAVAYGVSESSGDPNRVAIAGFCWGGRIVWLYAAQSTALKAGAAFYGRLVGQNSERQPKFPVDVIADLKAPVQGFYGGQDHGIPLNTVETVQALIDSAGKDSNIVVYPDAGHAFFADYRPSYNADAANDAWDMLLIWFAKHGV